MTFVGGDLCCCSMDYSYYSYCGKSTGPEIFRSRQNPYIGKAVNSLVAHKLSHHLCCFFWVLMGPYPTLWFDGACGADWGWGCSN